MEQCTKPLIALTHGHFYRVLAGRALGIAAEYARLFASVPASVSRIEDHDGERCLGLWNEDDALLEHPADPMPHPNRDEQVTAPLLPAGGPWS